MNDVHSAITTELIEAIPHPVIISRRSGEIVAANVQAGCLCGYDPKDLPGRQLDDLLVSEARAQSDPIGTSGVAGFVLRRTGDALPVRATSTMIQDSSLRVTALSLLTGYGQAEPGRDINVLETLSEGVIIVSSDGKINFLNQAAREMIGCEHGDYPRSDVRSIFIQPELHRGADEPEQHVLDEALSGVASVAAEQALLRCSSTTSLEISVNATPLESTTNGPAGAIITFQNITRQKHAELQISTQKSVLDMIAAGSSLEQAGAMIVEFLERVVPGTSGAIYQVERDSRRIEMVAAPNLHETVANVLTETAEDPVSALCVQTLISRRPLLYDLSAGDQISGFSELVNDTGIRSVWAYPVDASAQRSMGVICLYRNWEGPPDDEAELLIDTAVGLMRVALDRVQIERELRYQSFNDDLTGLPNRVLLMDRLDIALQRAAQSDDQVALLLMNIDKFQMVNNSLGHHAGDEMLRETAKRLRSSLRSDDLVARFTGDSFGILLEHISSEADAINVVMRIQRAFATPLNVTGVDIYASVSIGIAVATEPETDADSLVRYSHIALNRAKESGRGQFVIFSPAQDLSSVPKIELQSRLHRALAADALELHYQPVMSLREQQVAGYEALVRWTDEQFGTVSPDEFLPLAQQSGIMSEITSWVLDRAVAQLCLWHQAYDARIFAAVNISPVEMTDTLLVEQVHAVLSRYKVDPACLVLEMTEHAVLDTAGQPREILQRLRNLGVRIALDDFGTGYSSLSYLEHLSVDAIKIDAAFVQAARGGASRAPVATAMVELARQLGMISVAEGIETAEDERVARQLGCDYGQGYLYGRPKPGSMITMPLRVDRRAD